VIDRRTRIAQCVSSKHLRTLFYSLLLLFFFNIILCFCCGLWPTAALVGSVRNAPTYRFVRPERHRPRLGLGLVRRARDSRWPPRRRRRRHGTALRAASDRSDLAMISAPARRSHRSWGCAAHDAFFSPPPSHQLARN